MKDWLTRGKVAKEAGVNIETLRYYERVGVIPNPMRSESGYRLYTKETVQRIRFIKHAQGLGLTLKEIRDLLSISLVTKKQCQQVKGEIDHKLMEIDEKIKKLKEISTALKSLQKKCDEGGIDGKCPILKFLYGENNNDKD